MPEPTTREQLIALQEAMAEEQNTAAINLRDFMAGAEMDALKAKLVETRGHTVPGGWLDTAIGHIENVVRAVETQLGQQIKEPAPVDPAV